MGSWSFPWLNRENQQAYKQELEYARTSMPLAPEYLDDLATLARNGLLQD
jgi:hypothetical protein